MNPVLKILHLEDEPLDSELAGELLSSDGLQTRIDRVDTLPAFLQALEQDDYALILSDYTVPGTDPLEALRRARRIRPDIPYIFLSGTLGEDVAIETLKLGASDYVLKHKIARLVPAIRRALQEASEQSRRKVAEETLRRRTRSLKLISDTATRLLHEPDPRKLIRSIFDELASFLGWEIYINYLVAPDGLQLELNACAGIEPQLCGELAKLEFGAAVCGPVAQQLQSTIIPDVQHSSLPQARLIRSLGVRAYACHPLVASGKLVGTLSFGSQTRDHFSPEDLEVLRTVCDQIAVALERRRLVNELENRAAELNSARIAAEQAKVTAEEANAAKDQFIAVLSHELRTPLTAVLPAMDALEPRVPPDASEFLDIARRNIELEARLIDDLLDVTRIARGKVNLQHKPVDLWLTLRRAVEVCQPDLKASSMHFGLRVPDQPCIVHADPARLQQIFWNLIKNAIKFTPDQGCIGVYGRVNHNHASVSVSDSGIGIEPDVIGSIFGAFYQAERALTRRFGGLGLGLAISRALVELHGGSIRAQSDGKGHGATFTVELPIATPAEPPVTRPGAHPGADAARDHEPALRKFRILLVEDHPDTARILRRLLSARGHDVHHAATVASALNLARNQNFDVLVSDVGLPDGTGHDLLRQLIADGIPVPAIAVSGFGMASDIDKSRQAGFAEHITKPVNLETLLAAIRRATPNQLSP